MATNGHNGNGNGNGSKWNASKEVFSFLGAEAASITLSIGAFTFVDEIAPGMMEKISKTISKLCVEPHLDSIEKTLQKACKSEDCQPDFSKSREERAEHYAHYLTRFGISAAIGVGTELVLRKGLNHVLDVKHPSSNFVVCGIDKAIHLGLIGLVNTVGAKQTDTAIDATSLLLQKTLGWHPARADRAADVTVRWEAANWVSALVTSGYMVFRQLSGRNKA